MRASRRRRTAAVIVGLCLATAVPLSFADFTAGDAVQAAVAKAQSLVDLLDKRSPGQRTAAQLTKTKHKQITLAKVRPAERTQPVVAFAPLTSMPVELASLVMPGTPLVPPSLGQIDIGSPPALGSIVAPPGGGIGSSPGGVGGVTPGGGPPASNPTEPREPLIVTPPVPEPATWLTMLFGFGMIGWQIRRGKRRGDTLQAA